MTFRVVYAPEAEQALVDLYIYLADAASPETALQYVTELVRYCDSFATFPHRGTRRDDVLPGLRISHFRGRTVIAFAVDGECVNIAGFFHGGRDYEEILRNSAASSARLVL